MQIQTNLCVWRTISQQKHLYACRVEKVHCLNNNRINIEKAGFCSHNFFLSFTSSGIQYLFRRTDNKDLP